jgi:galactokinase
VTALRDVSRADLEARAAGLDEVTLRRARHVVTENERTLEAAEAMRRGDAAAMGRLMNASHASLQRDFEVSSPELDAIVECAMKHEACYGARMTGAGFGGCAVALVRAEAAGDFSASVATAYRSATDREAVLYVCEATDGASVVVGKGGNNVDCLGG